MKQLWALQKQDSVCSEYNEQIYLCPVKKKKLVYQRSVTTKRLIKMFMKIPYNFPPLGQNNFEVICNLITSTLEEIP